MVARVVYENVLKPILVAAIAILIGSTQSDCVPPGGDELEQVYRSELKRCDESSTSKKAACECKVLVDTSWGLCPEVEWPRIGRCDYTCQ